jgi:hypothetical protein
MSSIVPFHALDIASLTDALSSTKTTSTPLNLLRGALATLTRITSVRLKLEAPATSTRITSGLFNPKLGAPAISTREIR